MGGTAPLPAPGTTPQACHLGRGVGFVDEDEFGRIKLRRPLDPGHTRRFHVPALLFALLFLLLTTQAITGLILAGTDVYMPPFGNQVIEYIAAVDDKQNRLGEIRAGYKDNIDEQAYQRMRAYRKPVVTIHYTVFFILLAAILLHILGVIFTEVKEKNTIVSAMITGKKYFNSKPVDIDEEVTKS